MDFFVFQSCMENRVSSRRVFKATEKTYLKKQNQKRSSYLCYRVPYACHTLDITAQVRIPLTPRGCACLPKLGFPLSTMGWA